MNNTSAATLGDVVTLQRGHDLPATSRGAGDVPVIGSFGITGYHDVARYKGPGVAIGRSGASIGVATWCPTDYWPLNTCLFVKDFHGNDPRWVYYVLDSIDFTAYNSGSAQPSLNRNYLTNISVFLPPIEEQRGIAATLGALDDKIESNLRIISLLDEVNLSRVVSFNNEANAGLYEKIGDLGRVITGKTPSTKVASNFGGSIPFVTIPDLAKQNVIAVSGRYLSDDGVASVRGALVSPGSISISCIATVGECGIISKPSVTNQQINTLIPDRGLIATEYAYYQFRCLRNALLAAGGGGSVYTNVSKSRFEAIAIPVPSLALQEELVPASTVRMIERLEAQSRKLVKLRDTLMPELVSGRIHPRERGVAIGEVVA
jgi:type I restriction enzyme, S subunit